MKNRAYWRALAEERVMDAQQLLSGARWAGAYHLIGYAVECGLKSCVLAHLENGNAQLIFEQKKFSENCWTHDLIALIELAGLKASYERDKAANPRLDVNWQYAVKWKETSRYEARMQFDAERLVQAVIENPDGVLPWIRGHW